MARLNSWLTRDWHGPALVGGAGLVVFLLGIGSSALWYDEAATWATSSLKVGSMLRGFGEKDAVRGAFYLGEHFWMRAFGDSELALRLPSALAMAATAAMIVVIGRRWFSATAGLVAGVLFLLLPSATRYAQEANAYAVGCLLAAASTVLLTATKQLSRRAWFAYAGVVVALGVVELTAMLILAPHAVIAARRHRARGWLVAAGLACMAVAPLAFLGWQQKLAISWVPPSTIDGLAVALVALAGGAAALAFLVAVVVSVAPSHATLEPIAASAIAVTVLFVIGVFTPLFLGRYLLFLVPIAMVGVGASLSALGSRRLIAIVVLFAFVTLPDQLLLRTPAGHGIDGRSAVAWMLDRCQPGDDYVALGPTSLPVRYYVSVNDKCRLRETSLTDRNVASRVFVFRTTGTPGAATGPTGFRYQDGKQFFGIVITLYGRADGS